MAATQIQIDSYITDIRSAFAEYGESVALKQRLGKSNLYCDKVKLMLGSGYVDCLNDYFLQYSDNITSGESDVTVYNFFTVSEIRDIMQHLNNICGSNYIIEV
jgi:hypothetical protein